jgi:hypothetical protein
VPAESEGLKRCEKHGLSYDTRHSSGCVLCRRESGDAGIGRNRALFTLGGFALLAVLLAFCFLYVKPLLFATSEAHESFVGLAPNENKVDSPPPQGTAGEAAVGGAAAPSDTAVVQAQVQEQGGTSPLRPIDAAMWDEVSRPFQLYEGDESSVQELRNGYGIHIYIPPTDQLDIEQGKVTGTRPTPTQIATSARVLVSALARFPHAFVSRMGLQQVVLIDGVHHKGASVGAFAMGPAFVLFADPEAIANQTELTHELFHFIDYQLHGRPVDHSAWLALNTPAIRYMGGPRAVMRTGATAARLTALRRNLPGFVTEYAQSDSVEDMAETFAQLIVHPTELREVAAADPVIAAKVAYVTATLDRIAPGTATAMGL